MTRLYPTQEEATAAALIDSAPGEIVEVHTEQCEIKHDPETHQVIEPCTCDPLVLTVGAEA